MVIGVDFDNTVVCYEDAFCLAARERGLIPDGPLAAKGRVRDYLRRAGKESAWTELQGYVYGELIREAPAFEGVGTFFARCRDSGTEIYIISHKTAKPFLGPPYDLHRAARDWLVLQGLPAERAYFELTKEAKLGRIREARCTHFVDDLPEFLDDPAFPAGVERILFDPNGDNASYSGGPRVRSWGELENILWKKSS